jgi:hypothetical protein
MSERGCLCASQTATAGSRRWEGTDGCIWKSCF